MDIKIYLTNNYFQQNKCEQILQLPVASIEEIMELEELTDLHPEIFTDEEETQIILNHLQKIGKVAIEVSSDQPMIKFIVPTVKTKQSQLNNSGWSISPAKQKEKTIEITEVDRSLATLKRTEKLLNDEIESMESEMKTLEQTARMRLKEGSRGAVSLLQSFLILILTNSSYSFIGESCSVSTETTTSCL